jgi:predicted TIM-barrel fold metal-dependent hydrolase
MEFSEWLQYADPAMPAGDLSPTHPAYHPLWAFLQEHNVPFMLHVGGGGRPLRRVFVTTVSLRPPTGWVAGEIFAPRIT